jgi:Mg2+-importing ATPase
VLAAVSWLTEDIKATIVIGAMVLLSTLIRFVQEGRSNRAAERLKALVGNTARVLRRNRHRGRRCGRPVLGAHLHSRRPARLLDLPIRELVPGDHIVLSAGDMIPADCRVLTAKDLFVAQAAMTGESLPVEKFAHPATAWPACWHNLLFMGTNVVSGTATAVVLATGNRTYFGTLASAHRHRPCAHRLPGRRQQRQLAADPLRAGDGAVRVLINGWTKGDWTEAFLFALSVAVGLTPEMLPMIVTSTLAKGAVLLSRRKVIVKRLDAIQNFGAMEVLCTDKTGTLTQDKIALERHTDVFGTIRDVLKFAYLNSHFQTGLINLLDRAVLEHVELQSSLRLSQDYHKVDEIPFDFERRRMSVVVSEREDHHELICKGAVEEMLAVCSTVRENGQDMPLDEHRLARVRQTTEELNEPARGGGGDEGDRRQPDTYSQADECDLTLVGYVAFLDPPKESAAQALQALAAHGGGEGAHRRQRTGDRPRLRPGGAGRGS